MNIVVSGIWDFCISSLGAQALSDGLMIKLRRLYPGTDLQPFGPASLPLLRWFVSIVDKRPKLYDPWFFLIYLAYRLVNYKRIRAISSADLLVISGDGLVADIFATSTVMFACEIRYALAHGIPTISLNQSVNITPRTLAHYCVTHWFMKAPLSVREVDSQRELSRYFPNRDIPLAIDAAFLCPAPTDDELVRFGALSKAIRKDLGIDRYILVGIRGNRPSNQAIDEDAWCSVLKMTAEAFPGHTILLASTCAEHDAPLARRLARRVENAVVAEVLMDWETYNYRFYQVLLRDSVACISDRYHQNVLSILNGIPFIPVAGNTSKTGGIRDLLGWPIPIQPIPTKDNLPGYQKALDQLLTDYPRLQKQLREKAPPTIQLHDRYQQILKNAFKGL